MSCLKSQNFAHLKMPCTVSYRLLYLHLVPTACRLSTTFVNHSQNSHECLAKFMHPKSFRGDSDVVTTCTGKSSVPELATVRLATDRRPQCSLPPHQGSNSNVLVPSNASTLLPTFTPTCYPLADLVVS
jgi:hypothetical protein